MPYKKRRKPARHLIAKITRRFFSASVCQPLSSFASDTFLSMFDKKQAPCSSFFVSILLPEIHDTINCLSKAVSVSIQRLQQFPSFGNLFSLFGRHYLHKNLLSIILLHGPLPHPLPPAVHQGLLWMLHFPNR